MLRRRARRRALLRRLGLRLKRSLLAVPGAYIVAAVALGFAVPAIDRGVGAGRYSPRLVLWFRRDLLVKHAIGSFLAVPLYALVALRELELGRGGFSPDATVAFALVALVGASLLFLAMLRRVTDRLRPRALYPAVAREGIHAVRAVYPAHPQDAVLRSLRACGARRRPTWSR